MERIGNLQIDTDDPCELELHQPHRRRDNIIKLSLTQMLDLQRVINQQLERAGKYQIAQARQKQVPFHGLCDEFHSEY